jgi:hypothetical protein
VRSQVQGNARMNFARGTMKRTLAFLVAILMAMTCSAWTLGASAQTTPPSPPDAPGAPTLGISSSAVRDNGWGTVSTITAATAMASQLLMPRVFYAGPETTVGWKSRFHATVLAPTLVLAGITILNEYALKSAIGTKRPGCADTANPCKDSDPNEEMGSQSFAAFSALGLGAAIFVVDTTKWSDGKINAGSAVGHVVVPLALAVVTAIGRAAGNWEDAPSVILSSGVGLAIGAVVGVVYAEFVKPECGYSGNLICW